MLERYSYTPYGQATVDQRSSWGDRDGDGDVDATDKGTVGVTCTGTVAGACRILDLDFDGDYDAADATAFANLTQGIARRPAQSRSSLGQMFAHQGLLADVETKRYQNRHRGYDSNLARFLQREPRRQIVLSPQFNGAPEFPMWTSAAEAVHLTLYTLSSPIHYSDVFGLAAACSNIQGCPLIAPNLPPFVPGDGWCLDNKHSGFHVPPADSCYRSYGKSTSQSQCCYDGVNELICDGMPGAGNADLYAPAVGENPDNTCIFGTIAIIGHVIVDVLPSISLDMLLPILNLDDMLPSPFDPYWCCPCRCCVCD